MSKSVFVGSNATITIESAGGDLSVIGWDGSDLLIKGDEDDFRVEQTSEAVSVFSSDDLSLRVPRTASLMFKMIGGDASIRGVMGGCEIKEAGGDISVRDVGPLSIGSIHGDLSLSSVKGNVFVNSIHGDASMRDVDGDVTIETLSEDLSLRGVKGNLRVKNLGGDASIHGVDGNVMLDSVSDDLALRGVRGNIKVNVGEDVVVYLEPKADGEYTIDAGKDILIVLPKTANASLDIRGDEITMDWPGFENDESATERIVTLGEGGAKITLNAGGEVRISNRSDAGDSADEFGNFAGLNFDWSGFGERISRQVEQATARVAKRAEEAARRAERLAERHARRGKAGLVVGRLNWDLKGGVPRPASPPTPPTPLSEPVSEGERMAILKMLADKKITAEQAEQLLAALEGGT
ncbi:MAG TPA: DUF4097 family beta strand repeat-containing protein [Anaerolineales bacterium]|nr:DUF4097 family beta strand repeat-containing protein [Anaerolineales bacterium]